LIKIIGYEVFVFRALQGLWAKLGLGAIAILLSFQLLIAPAIAATVDDVPNLLEGDRTWVIDFADAISPEHRK
jgi:hypothetical protein